MSTLILHRGGQECTLEDLQAIPTPPQTRSYVPVGHHALANALLRMSGDLLWEFRLRDQQYGVARDGNQLFGIHTYENRSTEMGLSIGFRNSLDKSLSVGLAVGASVFVCDNLALSGEIRMMRKHTTNVWHDLEELISTSILRARTAFHSTLDLAEEMKGLPVDDERAWELLGKLYGRKVLTTRQLPIALREWHEPSHREFDPRTCWSLYNACTEALKSSPPRSILERHLHLSRVLGREMKEVQNA